MSCQSRHGWQGLVPASLNRAKDCKRKIQYIVTPTPQAQHKQPSAQWPTPYLAYIIMPVVYLQTGSTRSLWLYLPSTIGWGYFWGWSLVNWFLSLHSSLNSPFEMMNAKSLSLKCLYKLLTSAKFLNYNVIQILKGFGRHQGRGLWLHQSHSFTRNTHPSGAGGGRELRWRQKPWVN